MADRRATSTLRGSTMSHRFAGRRVAVVMGGLSAEREVSLNTGAGVVAALQERSWDVIAIDWQPGTSLARMLEQSGAAVVWNALHGTWGRSEEHTSELQSLRHLVCRLL